jgi:hypothetical protein
MSREEIPATNAAMPLPDILRALSTVWNKFPQRSIVCVDSAAKENFAVASLE